MRIDSPLPRHYFTDTPGVGGRIKLRPEDFIVEELPLYEPSGQGQHLYLRIQKVGVSHGELVAHLRRHFNVSDSAIGYAGMKDKLGVTRQTVSIDLPQDPGSVELDHERIGVLWADRHTNKIKRGHLAGNRFSIRIREVDAVKTPLVQRTVSTLERFGAPTWFGSQRFGYRCNNHLLGAMLLRAEWQNVADELLGSRGSPFPEYQRERRELYDAGRYQEAEMHWTTADRAELIVCRALARGQDVRNAVRAIGRITLIFWTSSLMSAAFNRTLDRRVEQGLVDQLVEGDVAFKHDSRATFAVTAEVLEDRSTSERLRRLEISPSGPLWGDDMRHASGKVAEVEEEALAATGVSEERVLSSRYHPEGGRRPFRAPLRNSDVEGGVDEHGSYIRTRFDLPRGTYATIVLREVMKGDRGA